MADGREGSEGGGEVKILQNIPRKKTRLFSENLNPLKTFFVIISKAQKLFTLSPIKPLNQFQKFWTIFQEISEKSPGHEL